jgi:hypothetical protein
MSYIQRMIHDIVTRQDAMSGTRMALIQHDHWCPCFLGTGGCECDPDIEYVSLEEYLRRLHNNTLPPPAVGRSRGGI